MTTGNKRIIAVVSIHAPTGGATLSVTCTDTRRSLFQSTLPRGERPYDVFTIYESKESFNPRSHGGSDVITSKWDANYEQFQSTLPRGERHGFVNNSTAMQGEFQSTLPRGERQTTWYQQRQDTCFNPRSHGGSDTLDIDYGTADVWVSIHAPTGGATFGAMQHNGLAKFQSTLPRGERQNQVKRKPPA